MKVKNPKPCVVNVWTGGGHESIGPGGEADIEEKYVAKLVKQGYLERVAGKPGSEPKHKGKGNK